MTTRDIDTHEPQLFIRPVGGFNPGAGRLLRDRLMSFELEDNFKLVDVARLEFDNTDGALFSKESMALGLKMEVSFGYVGNQAPGRILTCKKIRGLSGHRRRAGGIRPVRESLGGMGKVYMECWADLHKLHRLFADDGGGAESASPRVFENVTLTDIVRELAARHGYVGTSAIIAPLEHEVMFPRYTIPIDKTDGQWLREEANRNGYVFAIDEDGFKFHPRDYNQNDQVSLRFFSGDPDVMAYVVDGDLTFGSPRRVSARGVDAINVRAVVETHGPIDEGAQFNDGPAEGSSESREVGTPTQSVGSFQIVGAGRRARSEFDVLSVSRPSERARNAAVRRLEAQAEKKWKLQLDLVGNPRVRARQWLLCEGFGDMIDGLWFTRKVIHFYKAGNVYTTKIAEATRKKPGQSATRVHNTTAGVPGTQQPGSFQQVGVDD